MQVHDVDVIPVENESGELSDTFYRNCHFCKKIVRITPSNLKSCLQLGGPNFYCPFCLRNNHHYKSAQNILIMSYRGIIGYYYLEFYQGTNPRQKVWYSEIVRTIERHVSVGLQSPVFTYDPGTFLWFVDFNRIGAGRKKAPIEEVKQVSEAILKEFDLQRYISTFAETDVWDRFDKAIDAFYSQRKRPKDRRMLIPTLKGFNNFQKDGFWERTRDFRPANMVLK